MKIETCLSFKPLDLEKKRKSSNILFIHSSN